MFGRVHQQVFETASVTRTCRDRCSNLSTKKIPVEKAIVSRGNLELNVSVVVEQCFGSQDHFKFSVYLTPADSDMEFVTRALIVAGKVRDMPGIFHNVRLSIERYCLVMHCRKCSEFRAPTVKVCKRRRHKIILTYLFFSIFYRENFALLHDVYAHIFLDEVVYFCYFLPLHKKINTDTPIERLND